VRMNPVLKLWGNILGCGIFLAWVVELIASPPVEGTSRWLSGGWGVDVPELLARYLAGKARANRSPHQRTGLMAS
jgi:hypothetical protein